MASNDGKTISDGHFAHAKMYLIYDYDEKTRKLRLIGTRENPLGNIPDIDDPEAIHEALERLGVPMHGIEKYEWLRNNILSDIDAVIASGACQLSYSYFTSLGVELLFVEPGASIDEIVKQLSEPPKQNREE